MPLHRKVYATDILVGLFIVGIAGVGLDALRTDHDRTVALAGQHKSRDLLASAQRDVASSEVTLLRLLNLPRDVGTTREDRLVVYEQEQRGVNEWGSYLARAHRAGTVPPGAARLSTDLAALHTLRATQQVTANGQSPPGDLMKRATPAAAVSADFGIVQRAADTASAATLTRMSNNFRRFGLTLLLTALLALIAGAVAHILLGRAALRRNTELVQRDLDLERVASANEFEARLQRALELSSTEERVFRIVEQAVSEVTPDLSVEMLLADSSRGHFQQMVSRGDDASHFCTVDSPSHCPAAQRGEVLTFESSRALDACPFLKDQQSPCSATCVPVSVSGVTVGVVHATGPHLSPPGPDGRGALELVARRASDRIGVMRAFARSEAQASTDALTGLSNRRSLENAARRLTSNGTPYALAFGDLDHFKVVNDTFGHGAGDQALRVFAQVLRAELRPDDAVREDRAPGGRGTARGQAPGPGPGGDRREHRGRAGRPLHRRSGRERTAAGYR